MTHTLLPVLLAAGSATASDVALAGGMSLVDPALVTALLTGVAGVLSAAGTALWCRCKAGRPRRPLDSDDTFVTHGECKSHRCAIESRVNEIGPALNRLFAKLCENDRKSEERSLQLHRRLDPVVERVAANSARIETFERLAREATVGGHK